MLRRARDSDITQLVSCYNKITESCGIILKLYIVTSCLRFWELVLIVNYRDDVMSNALYSYEIISTLIFLSGRGVYVVPIKFQCGVATILSSSRQKPVLLIINRW